MKRTAMEKRKVTRLVVPALPSPYVKCPSCYRLTIDPSGNLNNLSVPASCCGATGKARIMWPNVEIHLFLGLVRKRTLTTEDGRRIAIVFLATALEMLLESILWELLAAHKSPSFISELVLNGCQGRERRIDLFRTLGEKSAADVLKPKKLDGFLADWKELAEARNSIVHGQYFYERKSDPRDLIIRVHGQCLQVFSELQNHAAEVRAAKKAASIAKV